MLTLTDSNFQKEVLASKAPVLVDFWAPWCIDPNTSVLNDRGEWVSARQVRRNDTLATYSGKTLNGSAVTYSIESSRMGHCREIVTETGRSIRLTDEHTLLTPSGWKKAEALTSNDRVAVHTGPYPVSSTPRRVMTLITEKDITSLALPSMRIAAYVAELKKRNLLLFKNTHPLLPTIARLMGSLFTDGGLYQGRNHYREMHFTAGTKRDALEIQQDLARLGFKAHMNFRKSVRYIGERSFTQRTFRVKCLATAPWLLLRALGVPEGSKVAQGYRVPQWLFDASPLVQREFLAGFMGGDGPKVSMRLKERPLVKKQPFNRLDINDIEFYKTTNYIKEGVAFAHDLARLFKGFDVRIKNIFIEDTKFPRHDGTHSSVVHIQFDTSFDNAGRLLSLIGYRYAESKGQSSQYVGEFIRRVLTRRKQWQELYRRAKKEWEKGMPLKEIGGKLNLSYGTLFGWLKKKKQPTVGYHLLKFPTWYRAAIRGLSGGLVWEPVRANNQCYLKTVQKITVEKNHNFIANGILVHNCGPCKIMGPILEELDKDFAGKSVTFAKMNVDDNPQTAPRYGVMSIPTLIMFKNGKPAEQWVGVQRKEDLKKKIEGLLK